MMRLRISSFPQIMMGAVICLCSLQTHGFVISDVRVEGLQRVSAGTVFGAIPFNVGDDIDEVDLRLIVRALFKTESFDDVQVGRDENILGTSCRAYRFGPWRRKHGAKRKPELSASASFGAQPMSRA